MKAIQKYGDGKDGMGLVEVPEPVVGPQDLLVEVGAVGMCGSDIHIWRDEKEHNRPVTLGHEFSGIIIGKGEQASDQWQIGDRICGDLETLEGRVGTHVNGAYAERLALPQQLAHRLPDNLTFAEGALIEQVTCMSHAAMHRSRINPADFVVITGPGPIGLTLLQIVKLFSPRAVMVTGLKDDTVRLEKALELGADYVYCSEDDPVAEVLRMTDGQGPTSCSTVRVARQPSPRPRAWSRTAAGSPSSACGAHDFQVNLDRIPYNNLTVRGSWGWDGMEYADQAVRLAAGWHSWERALRIMAMGKIELEPMITRNITLEEWRDAFEALEAKQEIKVMMYPNEKYMPG